MSVEVIYYPTERIEVGDFDCGEEELNAFLRDDAAHFVSTGLSSISLLVDQETREVLGFYTLSPTATNAHVLPQAKRDYYDVTFSIPSWLIGRLAVSRKHQKEGFGSLLLSHAMENIARRAHHGAGALVIVDAKNRKVKGFYKKCGFESLPTCSLKMVHPIAHS